MPNTIAWSTVNTFRRPISHYNGVVGQTSTSMVDQSFPNSLNGQKLPGWRKLIARHQSATTGLVKVENRIISRPGSGFTTVKHSTAGVANLTMYGYLSLPYATAPTLDWSSVQAAQDKATSIFLNKVHKINESGFSGQVFAAEFGKAVRQLRNPFYNLRGMLRQFLVNMASKKKDRSFMRLTTAQKLSVIGGSWLEWSFGVVPTLNDIEEALKLVDSLGNQDRYIKVRAVASEEISTSGQLLHDYGINSSTKFEVFTKNLNENECLVVGEVHRPASMVSPMGFAEKARFDFLEFVPTVYELIPYSWLLDYVTNVGDVLNTLSIDRSTVVWNSRTTTMIGVKQITGKFNSGYQKTIHGVNYVASGGDFGHSLRSTKRITRDVSPLGTPSFRFENKLSPMKLLNVAMLAASNVSTLNSLFGDYSHRTRLRNS